jgi:hypothetical protein
VANKAKGERKLALGDKEYTLFFNMNALAELEDALGVTIPKIASQMQDQDNIGIKFIRTLFWAGLLKYHRNDVPTIEDAGEILSEAEDLAQVFQAVGEAFAAAFPQDEKTVKEAQKKMKKLAGTGK